MKKVKKIVIMAILTIGLISNLGAYAGMNEGESKDINVISDEQRAVVNQENIDLDSISNMIQEKLNSFSATNSTTENSILQSLKMGITQNVLVSVKNFDMIKSTAISNGSVTGEVVIKKLSTDEIKNVPFELVIAKITNNLSNVVNGESATSTVVSNDNSAATTSSQVTLDTSNNLQTVTEAGVINIKQTIKVERLITQVVGTFKLGSVLVPEVNAYDEKGEIINLDGAKLTYEWFADNKRVGVNKEISITEEILNKGIRCVVNCPDYVEVIK